MATPRAPARSTATPTPGPSFAKEYSLIADAIYEYCRELHNDPDNDLILQEHLLKPNIIPEKNPETLMLVCQHLVNRRLFKLHTVAGGGVGWKLISREQAENYHDLSTDETLVYSIIDSSGPKGIWTKHIKSRLNIHAKVTERAFKTLESKGLIEPMKDVKYPTRKMYIRKGLMPSEEAMGGAWFTDGDLDEEMIDAAGKVIEKFVAEKTWVALKPAVAANALPPATTQKRKAPQDGFDVKGKGKAKMQKATSEQEYLSEQASADAHNVEIHVMNSHKAKTSNATTGTTYEPHPPEYKNFPTLESITNAVNTSGLLSRGLLPQNAVDQLLQVMVYDDKLIKMVTIAEMDSPSKTTYRSVKSPAQVAASARLAQRLVHEDEDIRKAARREQELEDIGRGGATEVPCLRCPVFDACEEGGLINAATCVYFDQWFEILEDTREMETEFT